MERYSYDVFGEPNRVSDVNNPYFFTGWSEPQVVARFRLLAAAFAAVALAILKVR